MIDEEKCKLCGGDRHYSTCPACGGIGECEFCDSRGWFLDCVNPNCQAFLQQAAAEQAVQAELLSSREDHREADEPQPA